MMRQLGAIAACLMLALCFWGSLEALAAEENGLCTRLPGPPDYPLPTLARDLDPGITASARLAAAETEELLRVTRDSRGHWLISRVNYHGEMSLGSELLLDLPPLDPSEEITAIRSGDFDGDGLGDLLLVRNVWPAWPLPIDLFLGREDGTLEDAQRLDYYSRSAPFVATGDYDGDGRAELAVFDGGLSVLRLFEFSRVTGWVKRSRKVIWGRGGITADVNSDGLDDLVLPTGGRWVIHFGDPDSPLLHELASSLNAFPEGMTWIGRRGEAGQLVYYERRGHRLVGLEYFPESGLLPAWEKALPSALSASFEARDVDRDGLNDLVTKVFAKTSASRHWPEAGFSIHAGIASGALEEVFRTDAPGRLMDSRDLDGDGTADAIVYQGSTWTSYRGLGGMRFDPGRKLSGLPPGQHSYAQTHDLDADGISDVVLLIDNEPWWMRGREDGSFDAHALESPEMGSARKLLVSDADGDGHLDLALITFYWPENAKRLAIAWGAGAGSFSRWEETLLLNWPQEGFFADFDGNGHLDFLALHVENSLNREFWQAQVFLGSDRTFTFAGGFDAPPRTPDVFEAGDLSGDGKEELLYFEKDPAPGDRYRLVGRAWNGAGFGDPWLAFDEALELPSYSRTLAIADLDGDGRNDLAMELRCEGEQDRFLRTLRGDGTGRFRRLGYGPKNDASTECPRVSWIDLDRDGVLDAVERLPQWTSPSGGPFRVWRGDGTGGFFPVEDDHLGARGLEGPLPGRFHSSFGLDPIHLLEFHDGYALAVTPQLVRPLDEDGAPPQVALLLVPDLDDTLDPPGFERRWRLNALIRDDCGAARANLLRIDLAELPDEATVAFLPAEEELWRIYEDPQSGRMEVLLRGPREQEVRERFARVRRAGGFLVEPNSVLEMVTHDEFGPSARSLGDSAAVSGGLRLSATYRLRRGRLDGVDVRRQGADIGLYAQATDHVGKSAEDRSSFRAKRDEFCGDPGASKLICH